MQNNYYLKLVTTKLRTQNFKNFIELSFLSTLIRTTNRLGEAHSKTFNGGTISIDDNAHLFTMLRLALIICESVVSINSGSTGLEPT
jgi:hypothetical protein